MKIKILMTLFVLGIAQSVMAYPISPEPLRKLVMNSEYIVYADVIQIVDSVAYSEAILVIRERLQGAISGDTIRVAFSPGMTCPSPAWYREKTTVLAFLDIEEGAYYTHALSYGEKEVEEADYRIYKNRIIEIQKILQIKEEKVQVEKTIDWLVLCAMDSVTRWEGVYELSPHSDFMSFYDTDEERFVKKYELNAAQKSKLRNVFFNIKSWTYEDMGLIDLVVKKKDPELINYLIKILKTKDREGHWYDQFIMAKLADFTGRRDLKKILQKVEKLDPWREKKEREQLLKEFLAKL